MQSQRAHQGDLIGRSVCVAGAAAAGWRERAIAGGGARRVGGGGLALEAAGVEELGRFVPLGGDLVGGLQALAGEAGD